MRRRGFSLALVLLALPRCRAGVDRKAVLAQLLRDVIVPQQVQLTSTAAALVAAARALVVDPAALAAAQTSWRAALAALERTYAAAAGPLANLGFRLRAAYWPVGPAAIEGLDATAGEIDRAGAAVKGLFAIEYLLFDPASVGRLADPARRDLLLRLCLNFDRVCRAAATDAQAGGRSVPKGAIITNAYVQFTSKYTRSMVTVLLIRGQAADNAPFFTTVSRSFTARVATAAQVVWNPVPPWVSDTSDATTRTPDLKSILQEIVNRPGWSAANAFVLLLSGNLGDRTALSYDGRSTAAPRLHVEYAIP